MPERRFRTLPLRDNLRSTGIRLGQKNLWIDEEGYTGPVDPQTAQSIEHLGGFSEVFDYGPPPVDLHSEDEVARAVAAADEQAPRGKGKKKGEG